jgi:hypothetical protein
MKVNQIRVTVREKLFVGNYETIEPEVTYYATLDPGDDRDVCTAQLFSLAEKAWAKEALMMLNRVLQRRAGDSTKKHEFIETTKGTRQQLKGMLSGN